MLPKLIHFAMSRDDAARLRGAHVPAARGEVLEVGIGSGLNIPFYTGAVTKLYGIDPSAELLARAAETAAKAPFPVELFNSSAEHIPLPDESVDTVVVTWSLCSIPNAPAALREMRRVLKPDGSLIFIEHGLSPDPAVEKWQNRLTPFWRPWTGGCHLNRKIDALVRDAGFTIADLRTEYVPGPRALTFMYEGRGRKTESKK
ncbi:MAG TPA: class I SAM-dependent methyltransferase [Vicinamibacterales bacterium]|nr:class I SAM-dependent methyltransferase [Vicinamibacterales bacterium]